MLEMTSTKKKVLTEMALVQEGEMNPFPLQGNRQSCGVMFTENIAVYCHCKQLYEPTRFMVEWGGCSDWFHHLCKKVPKKVTDKTKFICKNCKIDDL